MKYKVDYEVEDTSQVKYQASEQGVQRFQESAFGLSVHWGLYALLTRSDEWIYFREQILYEKYRQRMNRFNSYRFDADEWADLMLEADTKFLIVTSKHHDGFYLWDTQLTGFKITNTPFGRDILKELADALHVRGLGLHFYYSLVDWNHPAYRKDWPAYVTYYQGQIHGLCTDFGQIGGFIFDGYWPRQEFEDVEIEYFEPGGSWDLAGTYDLIHELHRGAMIANNTHVLPLSGEDYQVWELDLPGENTAGFDTTEVGERPTAVWWNLNTGWSYQPWNYALKSTSEIVEVYHKTREQQAVFFLNVGPRRFGDIHPEEQRVLREIGQIIRKRG